MPSLSASRLASLATGDHTDCYCVRLVRRDGVTLRFTSFPRDIVCSSAWDGAVESSITAVTYKANTGYQMTAIEQSASLAIDNIDIQGIYQNTGITRADILAGLYDNAQVYIFLTDYENPVEDEQMLKKAVHGITFAYDETFKIEFRGLTQMLNQVVGRKITTISSRDLEAEGVPLVAPLWQASTVYSAPKGTYDWRPGGTQANVVRPSTPNGRWYYISDPGTSGGTEPTWPSSGTVTDGGAEWTAFRAYSYDGTVTTVVSGEEFTSSNLSSFDEDWFADGHITFNSGDNAGQTIEVRSFSGSTVILFLGAPFAIGVGDTFTATVGYNRTLEQCRDKFANTVNFGGFPYLPGPRTAAKIGFQQ